jgi:hypothetical protein
MAAAVDDLQNWPLAPLRQPTSRWILDGNAVGLHLYYITYGVNTRLIQENRLHTGFFQFRCSSQLCNIIGDSYVVRVTGSAELASGEIYQMCDQDMQDRQQAGEMFWRKRAGDIAEQWEEIKVTFGCDVDNEADNWWVKWGLLRQQR